MLCYTAMLGWWESVFYATVYMFFADIIES
jgi:hypothetical protein